MTHTNKNVFQPHGQAEYFTESGSCSNTSVPKKAWGRCMLNGSIKKVLLFYCQTVSCFIKDSLERQLS